MEAMLNKKSLKCYRKTLDSRFCREETMEAVVPDVLPDVGKIIDADGIFLIRSKEPGNGMVTIAGTIVANIIYISEDEGEINKLSVSIPFSAGAESPEIAEDCAVVANARIISVDARVLNTRKILVRANTEITILCFEEGYVQYCDGLSEEEAVDIQVKKKERSLAPISGVREKTFIITDEYQIPGTRPPIEELLKYRVNLIVDDVKTVGTKLIFNGDAQVDILYLDGEEGSLETVSYTTEFSQIMEMDTAKEAMGASLTLMLTGAYLENSPDYGDGVINAEIHVVAQAVLYEPNEIEYISDAYSNDYTLILNVDDLYLGSEIKKYTVHETVRDTIDGAGGIGEVVYVYAVPGLSEVIDGEVKSEITAYVVGKNDTGELSAYSKKITVESKTDIDKDAEALVTGIRCSEVYAAPQGGEIEVRFNIDVDFQVMEYGDISLISGIEICEDEPIDKDGKPSLTVLRTEDGGDIWLLAKNNCSTPDLIIEANKLAEPEIQGDRIILIPKAR